MVRTADWYRRFAAEDARGASPIYEEWALGVAGDQSVMALIEQLPLQKRQPNLIFAVSRLLGAPEAGWPEYRQWLLREWQEVAREASSRSTQTNEPGRCAAVLPVLAGLEGPLALLEIGAAAGLCLYPDRYAYRYGSGPVLGRGTDSTSSLVLNCQTSGAVPVPDRLPVVSSRIGVDLDPLLLDRPDDMLWLETLLWPEQHERRARLRKAIEIARQSPPVLLQADAIAGLEVGAAATPPGSRLVVLTTGVLVYLPRAERERFVKAVRELDCAWVSLEGVNVLPDTAARLRVPVPAETRFVVALDGIPVALTAPHGTRLHWLGDREVVRD
jgi:hypothetical protein